MKTREELASEYARIENYKVGTLTRAVAQGMYQDYSKGFDAGFARAVELLRSNDAAAARYAENFQYLLREGKMSPPQKFFADWLEKQQKTPDETFVEEKK